MYFTTILLFILQFQLERSGKETFRLQPSLHCTHACRHNAPCAADMSDIPPRYSCGAYVCFCYYTIFSSNFSWSVVKNKYMWNATRPAMDARTQAQCSMRSRYVRYSTLMLPTALHLMAKASRIILLPPQLFRIFQDMSDIPKNMPDIHLHISKCP